MAKNYTFAEAVKIINEGTDLEALVDIGRRYPVLMHKVTQVCVLAGEEFVELMGFMPEYLTANKVNSAIKALITGEGSGDDSGSDEGDGDDSGETGKDYESMSAKQLYEILKKAGKHKTAASTKKADLLAAVKAMEAGEGSEDDGDDDGEESGNPYEGKTAMELFKECKKRGIKAAPKKPAKFYADLLTKNDAESKDDGDDDGEDWDEDDGEETKKETKAAGKGAKTEKAGSKKGGKPAKKDEDDDGDNWDI